MTYGTHERPPEEELPRGPRRTERWQRQAWLKKCSDSLLVAGCLILCGLGIVGMAMFLSAYPRLGVALLLVWGVGLVAVSYFMHCASKRLN